MSYYYAPCFYKIVFVVIPSYIEVSWFNKLKKSKQKININSHSLTILEKLSD